MLHIAQSDARLLPSDPAARARAIGWIFCAPNTLEVPLLQLAELNIFSAGKPWTDGARPRVERWVRQRLGELERRAESGNRFRQFSRSKYLI